MIDRIGAAFEIDDSIVSAFGVEAERQDSQQRYRHWADWLRDPNSRFKHEYLVPRIRVPVRPSVPGWMQPASPVDPEPLRQRVEAMGPWHQSFDLGGGVNTMEGMRAAVAFERILFRRELISAVLAEILGTDLVGSSVLDIGCNCGFFSLDMAARGAKVHGVDLRVENIEQARFLADHYRSERVRFDVSDADRLPEEQYDVVMNLGVLYHVTNPLEFLAQTYRLCRQVAVIDTVCLLEPVSAFMMVGDKDVSQPAEGREVVELHPTYRAAIETIQHAGFRHVIEVVAGDVVGPHHEFYAGGMRRCFLAVK